MPMDPATAQALGNLINDLNPTSTRTLKLIGLDRASNSVADGPQYRHGTDHAPPRQHRRRRYPPTASPDIQLEVDSKYSAQWTFAGEPQSIDVALRYVSLSGESGFGGDRVDRGLSADRLSGQRRLT